jgi:Aromatic-ring-opening dioxygenase LigAB, LigA subunit
MSVYGVHKLLKRIRYDAGFRDRLVSEPRSALAEFPLTDEECSALLAGEVGVLNRMGVHGYMLNTLARHQLFGLTPERYMERIRT